MQPKSYLWHKVSALLGFIAFIALAIISLFVFSYLLILFAIIGFLIFAVGYVRLKWLGMKMSHRHHTAQQRNPQHPVHKGRVIDADDD